MSDQNLDLYFYVKFMKKLIKGEYTKTTLKSDDVTLGITGIEQVLLSISLEKKEYIEKLMEITPGTGDPSRPDPIMTAARDLGENIVRPIKFVFQPADAAHIKLDIQKIIDDKTKLTKDPRNTNGYTDNDPRKDMQLVILFKVLTDMGIDVSYKKIKTFVDPILPQFKGILTNTSADIKNYYVKIVDKGGVKTIDDTPDGHWLTEVSTADTLPAKSWPARTMELLDDDSDGSRTNKECDVWKNFRRQKKKRRRRL